ncbi:MAG: alanine racemase, partial [Nitrospinales bacterium]
MQPCSSLLMAHHRATYAEINLDAFRHNIQTIRKTLQPGVGIMAVVKADAYGHGAVPCAQAALEAGADYLGIGIIEEGIQLRENGITAPILVLGSFFTEEARDLVHFNLVPTLCTQRQAQAISEHAKASGKPLKVHIKIDTGMTRLGVQPDQFLSLVDFVLQCKNIEIEAVSTHFSSADEEDPEFTLHQLNLFSNALKQMKKTGIQVPLIHTANSAAILKYPESHFNMVRPGLLLYGALPSPNLKASAEALAERNKGKGFIP